MIFNGADFATLAQLFDRPGYAGYKPDVVESPNGDGNLDAGKRYLHVALKYDPPAWALWFLARAHWEACRVAEALGVPAEYYPRIADGTLRVLEYPVDAGSAMHTDMSLFTVKCFRDPELDKSPFHIGELGTLVDLGPAAPHSIPALSVPQRSIVYFAMPDHQARLPGGQPVWHWLQERIKRSRAYAGEEYVR